MKRITALVLVVIMLALTLVGCGYSYEKDDMSKYATFDKTAFEEALKSITIEDGDFTIDEAIRNQKVIDSIYEVLVGKVDSDNKIKEGTVGAHDKFYYCYYVTATFDGAEVMLFASSMKESSAANVQFGLTDTEGVKKLVEDTFSGVDIKDMAYSTTTTGKAASGKTAFISYTVEYDEVVDGKETVKKNTYTYERVTIGDVNHPVANRLVDSTIGSTVDAFEIEGKKYSSAKVDWVVDAGAEKTFTDKTYTSAKSETDTAGVTRELKDVELTYHVYPVYFLEVEDFNATAVLKTILTKLVTETEDDHEHEEGEEHEHTTYALPIFENHAEAAKAIDELKAALTTATKEYDDALEAKEAAEEALKKAEDAVAEGATPTEAQQATIDKAKETLNGNADKYQPTDKGYIKGAIPTFNEKDEAKKTAENNLNTKISEFIATVGEDTIVEEYKKTVYDNLLEEYNKEIRMNIAGAVWALMQANSTASGNNLPEGAIQNAYDRMIEQYEYTFYEGTYDSSTSESNYKRYNGNFREFLMSKTGAKTYTDAKHEVWADAKEYVVPIVTIYAAAETCGLELTKDELKAAMEDTSKSYSYYEYYNGEENVKVAIQFDKIMNYYLESETNEDTGVVTYKKLTYTITAKDA